MRLDKILVPTDFSETADHALDQAVALARRHGSEILLFHVVEPHAEPPPHMMAMVAEYIDHMHAAAVEALEAKSKDLRSASIDVRGDAVRHVAPTEAIRNMVEAYSPDLLILGTHGRRGFRRLVLGSVTESVLRSVPVDVLSLGLDAPSISADGAFRRILVPVDFSEPSKRALERALALAGADGQVHVVHVVHIPASPAFYPGPVFPPSGPDPSLDDKIHTHVDEWLGGKDASLDIRVGEASGGILDVCEERKPDLIVMGTRGLTGVNHFLLGSVAERVVRRASVPVMTVH